MSDAEIAMSDTDSDNDGYSLPTPRVMGGGAVHKSKGKTLTFQDRRNQHLADIAAKKKHKKQKVNEDTPASAPPPPEQAVSLDEESDLDTSVSGRIPVSPMAEILRVLGPEHRAMVLALQTERDEAVSAVAASAQLAADSAAQLDTAKRERDSKGAEVLALTKRVKTLETTTAALTAAVSDSVSGTTPEDAQFGPDLLDATGADGLTIPPPMRRDRARAHPASTDSGEREEQCDIDDAFKQAGAETEVFAVYKSLVAAGRPHPTALCSSNNLGDTIAPEVKASLKDFLHASVRDNTAFSDAQLEAIAAASRRNHVDKLAFACGDATGVGKTREALGFVMNNALLHGGMSSPKPRLLYISVSNLFTDVVRDAEAIGMAAKDFCNGVELKNKGKSAISIPQPFLFASHTTLGSFTATGLLKWLFSGKNLNAPPVLVFDEVHKCANKGTRRFREAIQLIDGAHEQGANIMLLSATFASSLQQVELVAKSVGLVRSPKHPTHPVVEFRELKHSIDRIGEIGLEALTMQLRSSGGYVARQLSMAGVEFQRVECSLSAVDRERHAAAALLWKDMHASAHVFSTKNGSGVFHGASLRFFKALTMYTRLPTVIGEAKDALARGDQVLLTCLSTDEAAIKRASASADEEDDEESANDKVDDAEAEARLTNGALVDCILQVTAYARKDINAALDATTTAALDAIDARAKALGLPVVGPLDAVKHALTLHLDNDSNQVVELTGRKRMVECGFDADSTDASNWKIVDRAEAAAQGKSRFQLGQARVALLSSAYSTGCSLHDVNGARRVVIALELPYSSILHVQMCGRTHRAGEKSQPLFVLPFCPDLQAEERFVSSISARLAQLGALCVADRRSGAGAMDFGDAAELTGKLANRAASIVALKHEINLGSTPTSIKLMNRALARAPDDGNAIMTAFKLELKMRKASAGPPSSVIDVDLDGLRMSEIESVVRAKSDDIPGESLLKTIQHDRGVHWTDVHKKMTACAEARVCKRIEPDMRPNAPSPIVLAWPAPDGEDVILSRPNGTVAKMQKARFEAAFRGLNLSDAETEREWLDELKKAKDGKFRLRYYYVLTLPALDFVATNWMYDVDVIRLSYTDDRQPLLGIRLDKGQRNRVYEEVKAAAEAQQRAAEQGEAEGGPSPDAVDAGEAAEPMEA